MANATYSINRFVREANARLPMSGTDRHTLVQAVVKTLNGALPPRRLGRCELLWAKASMCPLDALSLLVRPNGAKRWREYTILNIGWGVSREGSYSIKSIEEIKTASTDEVNAILRTCQDSA